MTEPSGFDRREALVTTAWAGLLAIPVLPLAIELARRFDAPHRLAPSWVQGIVSAVGAVWLAVAGARLAGARWEHGDRVALLVAAAFGGYMIGVFAVFLLVWRQEHFGLAAILAPAPAFGCAVIAAREAGRRVLIRKGEVVGATFVPLGLLANLLFLAVAWLLLELLRVGVVPSTCVLLAGSVVLQLWVAHVVVCRAEGSPG